MRTAVIFDLERRRVSTIQRIPTATCWPATGSAWRDRRVQAGPAQPLVWQCIQDYLAGTRLPLSALKAFMRAVRNSFLTLWDRDKKNDFPLPGSPMGKAAWRCDRGAKLW